MKVKYKTILMIAFVSILVCGIEISAKEKRVGAFQFSYVTLDGDNVQITKIIPTQETIPDKLIIPDKIDGKSVVKLGDLYDDDDGGRGINFFGIYLLEETKKKKPQSPCLRISCILSGISVWWSEIWRKISAKRGTQTTQD